MTMAYAAGARKYGATLLVDTPVVGLKQRSDSKWDVTTNEGTVVAKHVINATGMFL